jgi:hypothetical protein
VLTGHFPARHFAHGHIATVSSHAQRAMQDWPLHSIRDGRWKLLVGRQPRQVELFRFPEDRLERTDVSAEYPQVVQALNAKIVAWLACCRRWLMVSAFLCSARRPKRVEGDAVRPFAE